MSKQLVGILIIGDEILKGHVADKNTHFLCQRFYQLGFKVARVTFIGDNIDEISDEVSKFSQLYDVVVTTGGVGPTHDDVTYEAVAKAFGETVQLNEKLREHFYNYLYRDGDNKNNPLLRMVNVPPSSEIIMTHVPESLKLGKFFPIVKVRNVFILPGVPKFIEHMFLSLEEKYFSKENKFVFCRVIYTVRSENVIGPILYNVVEQYKNSVTFGSYPECGLNPDYETKIIIESSVMEDCLAAESNLLMEISPSWITYIENTASILNYDLFTRFLLTENTLVSVVKSSLKIIEECFDRYSLSNIFLCYNGGKDCTVLLYLVHYVYNLRNYHKREPLKTLYVKNGSFFPEEDKFVIDVSKRYKLDLTIFNASIKDSLVSWLQKDPNRNVSFTGIRRSDPSGIASQPFQITDADWPQVMKVLPVLHWSYDDIWNFIRVLNIPYCSLYNYGYTSIGSPEDTLPNDALLVNDVYSGKVYYRPAYLLQKCSSERQGRSNNVS